MSSLSDSYSTHSSPGLIYLQAFIDKETFWVLVKPNLARYIDKDADKTGTSESILETGPKDIIWVSNLSIHEGVLTVDFYTEHSYGHSEHWI